jgi:hypothetical protein
MCCVKVGQDSGGESCFILVFWVRRLTYTIIKRSKDGRNKIQLDLEGIIITGNTYHNKRGILCYPLPYPAVPL